MGGALQKDHKAACSARVGPISTQPVQSRGAEQEELISAEGWWSNCDVYVELPAAWVAADPTVELWAFSGGMRTLVATTTVVGAGLAPNGAGGVRGIILEGRGHPGAQWLVTVNSGTAPVEAGEISLELWGTESTPEGIGRTPANPGAVLAAPDGVPDQRMPYRASFLMGWPWGEPPNGGPGAAGGPWLPVAIDGDTGHLIVDVSSSPAAPVVVTGNKTPSDTYANPTDHVGTWALLGGWRNTAAEWTRLRSLDGTDGTITPGPISRSLSTVGFPYNFNAGSGRWTRTAGDANGNTTVVGTVTPADASANPTDAVPTWSHSAGWNGATWDRARSTANNAATKAAIATGVQETAANLYGFGANSLSWNRLVSTNIGGQFAGGDMTLVTFAALASFQPASGQYVGLRTGPNSPAGITSLYVKDGPPAISAEASPVPFLFVDTIAAAIKASAGNLLSLSFSGIAAGGYFAICNTVAAPVVGSIAIMALAVPAAGVTVHVSRETLSMAGINLATGISFAYCTGINPATNAITGLAAAVVGTVTGTRV